MDEQIVHSMFLEVRDGLSKVHGRIDEMVRVQQVQEIQITKIVGVCDSREKEIKSNRDAIKTVNEKGCQTAGCTGVDKKRMAGFGAAVGGGIAGALFMVVKVVEYWPKIVNFFK